MKMSVSRAANFIAVCVVAALCCVSCKRDAGNFSYEELLLISGVDSVMRVLTVQDSSDLAILRAKSKDLSAKALLSKEYGLLVEKMIATVTHPSQDGVGIAAPQVGLNRNVVAVQRFDKEPVLWNNGRRDHPFEVYPNIRIVWASDSLVLGPEGCLSVPGKRGDVLRSEKIVIEYTDLDQLKASRKGSSQRRGAHCESLPVARDTVSGFTAVIFQHETDHLSGILYTDRLIGHSSDFCPLSSII